jgi:hypothetical protein
MTVWAAKIHAHAQRSVSVLKMVTMLEGSTKKSSVLVCIFCGQKNLMQRIVITKCLLLMVGSICPIQQLTSGSRKFLKDVQIIDNARPRCPVEIVEEGTAPGCSYGVAYSTMHDRLKFCKVYGHRTEGLIKNEPRKEFKNYSGNFLNIRLMAQIWPLVTSICSVHKNHLGGKRFTDDDEAEMEVRKWL